MMKRKHHYRFFAAGPVIALCISGSAPAADLYWDGGNIGGTGDGASTYAGGTWSTANANWDPGAALSRVAWNNSNLDNAVFSGAYSTGLKTVSIGSNITVNQIQVLTGSTGGNRYDIGASNTQNDFAITFGGTYSDSVPTITGNAGFANTNFNAKITGTIDGGLVLNHGSNGINPASGRFAFTNANNDFVGDVILIGGNLGVSNNFGHSANKLVLKGGSLFASGLGPSTFSRDIAVSSNSHINFNATGTHIFDLTGAITGAAELKRISAANAGGELRLSGNMAGFTGTIDQAGIGTMTIQTTATSGGAWKLTSGTLKLNTADDTHIANGIGKSNLLMNGGTLDMNGRNETVNGLSGATGTVQNALAASTSTITVGDGDASTDFGGVLRNNAGTGGTLALVKTGNGTQTLSGINTYTGDTLVSAGTLLVNGQLGNTSVTVAGAATIGGDGVIGGALHFDAGAKFAFDVNQTLTINGSGVTFDGFGVADLTGLDNLVPNNTYVLLDGTATVSTLNLANIGLANAYPLGGGKSAYFQPGSLNLIVIPEPAPVLLGGLGFCCLLRRRRA
jgi:autotransporter-associated beta strand protein